MIAIAACGSAGSPNSDAMQADAGGDAAPAGSRCTDDGVTLSCTYTTRVAHIGAGREVHYQAPVGAAPAAGWPVVLMFQGSLFSAELAWSADRSVPFGGYHQVELVRELLDGGFAVIAPETKLDGNTYWDTNVPPWATNWTTSSDHQLVQQLLSQIADGTFGPLDPARLHATGISSGGYMTSRMALSYVGTFRSLAIHSASWATCSGALCVVPATLPADHPPTLFVHGTLDEVVPISTMRPYHARLQSAGIATRIEEHPEGGHAFLPATSIAAWFVAHP